MQNKLIKESYKLFAINNESYLYNYTYYSSIQSLEGRLKVKELEETLAIVVKLVTNILLSNIILFINNYFIELKLAIALKDREIAIYNIIKYNRLDLLKLLIDMKKEFAKNILYKVLAVIIQNNILIVA